MPSTKNASATATADNYDIHNDDDNRPIPFDFSSSASNSYGGGGDFFSSATVVAHSPPFDDTNTLTHSAVTSAIPIAQTSQTTHSQHNDSSLYNLDFLDDDPFAVTTSTTTFIATTATTGENPVPTTTAGIFVLSTTQINYQMTIHMTISHLHSVQTY